MPLVRSKKVRKIKNMEAKGENMPPMSPLVKWDHVPSVTPTPWIHLCEYCLNKDGGLS